MYNIEKINEAYTTYNCDNRENLEQQVYHQFGSIIQESKEEIERLSNYNDSYIKYDRIMQIYNENDKNFEYKKNISSEKLNNNFISVVYKAPIGLIYAEVDTDEQALIEILNCIKNRDGLLLSLADWNEFDMKHYLLLLAKKALSMYEISENLIEMVPYEECDESEFDLKKYCFYKNEKEYKENDKLNYVYIENSYFDKVARENRNATILVGEYEDVIKDLSINKHNAIAIYTHDLKLAYQMATQIRAENVLINTDISFAKEIVEEDNDYLMNKHVMFEYTNIINY